MPTYTFEVIRGRKLAPAWKLPEDHPLVRAALAGLRAAGLPAATGAYRFCTNGSESAGVLNIPTIGFGPARETDAHVRDESVAVADLRAAFRGFVGILAEVQQLPRVAPRVGPGQGMPIGWV